MRDIRILQEAENNAKLSKQARLYLELAIIKMCKIEYDTSNEVVLARVNKIEEALRSGKIQVRTSNGGAEQNNTPHTIAKAPAAHNTKMVHTEPQIEANVNSKTKIGDVQRAWKDILETFKSRRAMVIYASMLTGKPIACNNGILTIKYDEQYDFNKQRLEKAENIKVVNEVVSEVMRENIKVKFVVENTGVDERRPEDILIDTLGSSIVEVLDE